MRVVALALLMVACTACVPRVVTRPGPVQYRDRLVYVPVSNALTEERPIAEGPLSECPRVAAERGAELEAANGQLRSIRNKHGTRQP